MTRNEAAQERAEALLSLADDLVEIDDGARLVRVGAAAARLLGHGDGERLRGAPAASLFDRGAELAALVEELRAGPIDRRVFTARTADGRARRLLLSARAVAGGVLARVARATDDATFGAVYDGLPIAIGIAQRGAIVYVNEYFLRMFGHASLDELRGTPAIAKWAERSRPDVARFVAAYLEDSTHRAEIVGFGLRSDGSELPVRCALSSMELPNGPAAIGVFTDLSEQRAAEEALRRSEAFYRAVLTRSPEILTVIGEDGRYRFVSSAVKQQLGYDEAEGATMAAFDLVHPDDRERVRAGFDRLRENPQHIEQLRYRVRRKDGVYKTFEAIAHNQIDNPDVAGIVGNARDVTDQVALEEQFLQAQKLESIGRLAGGVAHDFNNVLTIILSSAELIEESMKLGLPPAIEDVHEISSAAQRASELTQQLLAVARKQVIAPVTLDLNQLVRSSEKMLRRLVGEDIAVMLKLDPHAGTMSADPGQLHQILLNLAVNARDAMPKGGLLTLETSKVSVPSGWRDLPEGDWVRLVVRDSGVGMSPEILAHVFEPFFTTKPVGRGTGLGLATVHGIVAQCGGHVRVESAPGRGARFDLYFPLGTGEPVALSTRNSTPARGNETLLLVEDDRGVREVAARTLEGAGFRVVAAGDGYEALALYEGIGAAVALLVTDVIMPRMDGPRLAAALRERQPGLRVLFTSGYTDDRIAAHGVLEPEVDLLPKPYTPSGLLQRVRAALDRA